MAFLKVGDPVLYGDNRTPANVVKVDISDRTFPYLIQFTPAYPWKNGISVWVGAEALKPTSKQDEPKFMVGDRVRVLERGGISRQWHLPGSVLTVTKISSNGHPDFAENTSNLLCHRDWYELVARPRLNQKKTMAFHASAERIEIKTPCPNWDLTTLPTPNNNKWAFNVRNPGGIDFSKIRDNMSYKRPIALVSAGKKHYVQVHPQLTAKATRIDVLLPGYKVLLAGGVFEVKPDHFNDWIEWGREVKQAKWPGKRSPKTGKLTVEVVMPGV